MIAWTRRWAAMVTLGFAWALAAEAGAQISPPLEPGDPVPDITLFDIEGQPHRLEDATRDRSVLLFFWSVYCPNCKEAMPELIRLARQERSRFAVWAINVDGERFSNGVKAYARQLEAPFPILYDRLEGEYLVAADPLGVTRTPTLYLVNPQRRVVMRQAVQVDCERVAIRLAAIEEQ